MFFCLLLNFYLIYYLFFDTITLFLAGLVKWLTRRIVAPVCVGSIPTFRPIKIFGEAEISFTFSFANPLFIGDSRDFDNFIIFLLFIKTLKITKK